MQRFDVVVVGGGIAGVSAAQAISLSHSVCVLEQESVPGFHATGRSATMFALAYGDRITRALAAASRSFLESPPPGFDDGPLTTPRGMLHVASYGQEQAFQRFLHEVGQVGDEELVQLDAAEVRACVPILGQAPILGGLLDQAASSIDDHRLFQGYLRALKTTDGTLRCGVKLNSIEKTGSRFRIGTSFGPVEATFLVNAAGAWADEVATLSGLQPLGLQALRRTAITIDPPAGLDPSDWPMAIDVEERWYVKPEAGRLLLSPADETLVEPQDAQAEEWDVAVAIDRYSRLTGHEPRRIHHRWAGLRTFAPDRAPVAGWDPDCASFLWLVGQGGSGFMTAPAMAGIAAALVDGRDLPAELGLTEPELSPARLHSKPG